MIMVDTAGTITKAADVMKEAGAKSVRAIASHCVMSGPATERCRGFFFGGDGLYRFYPIHCSLLKG